MKKIIFILSIAALLGATALANHLIVEKQWRIWKIYGMEIRDRAYKVGKLNKWTTEEIDKFTEEQLEKNGIEKPNFCLYCWYWKLTH